MEVLGTRAVRDFKEDELIRNKGEFNFDMHKIAVVTTTRAEYGDIAQDVKTFGTR